jgi:hypothetical protein
MPRNERGQAGVISGGILTLFPFESLISIPGLFFVIRTASWNRLRLTCYDCPYGPYD